MYSKCKLARNEPSIIKRTRHRIRNYKKILTILKLLNIKSEFLSITLNACEAFFNPCRKKKNSYLCALNLNSPVVKFYISANIFARKRKKKKC